MPFIPVQSTGHSGNLRKESRPGGLSFELTTKERLKFEGIGRKAKTIR
jgi:hypothetical protein